MPFPAQPTPPRRVVGLDPGLHTTGYAVLEPVPGRSPRVCEAGVIRAAAAEGASGLAARVRVLYDGLVEVLDQWQPAAAAVEQLFAHYDHPRTAILMAHARGCFFLAAAQRNIAVAGYPPARVKKTITGSGRASKEQMQHAVMRELGLPKPPEPHDVADALAIALCHCYAAAGWGGGKSGAKVTAVDLSRLHGRDDEADEAA